MTLPFRRTLADREDVLGGAMLAPALAYVILLVGVPFAFAIALGFSNATAGSLSFGWAGLHNYRAILSDPIFLRALRNSVVVTVGSQVLVVILATAAAQVFRATFRGKRFARFVLLLPWAVPVSLAAIAWTWIFDCSCRSSPSRCYSAWCTRRPTWASSTSSRVAGRPTRRMSCPRSRSSAAFSALTWDRVRRSPCSCSPS